MIDVGVEVICIHVETVANSYHNAHPVVKGRVYTVLKVIKFKDGEVGITVQPEFTFPPAWPIQWFRPLDKSKKTDITFAYSILKREERQPILLPAKKVPALSLVMASAIGE